MELVFEMLSSKQFVPTDLCHKTFTQAGGVIGRGEDCDWIIPDRKRHLSSHHATVSFHNGAFLLTDTSSNGIQDGVSGGHLIKGEAVRIETGSFYLLGDFEIRARLSYDSPRANIESPGSRTPFNVIPDDVFLDLDPLKLLEQQELMHREVDELSALDTPYQEPMQRADFARIDMENLRVPVLIDVPPDPAPITTPEVGEGQNEDFWEHFGAALGVDLKGLDRASREALALNAAGMLKQSISGLQQSLRTRNELKNDLRLAQSTVQGFQTNPFRFAVDAGEALELLLLTNKSGQISADQVIPRAFRDLQAHQVASLTASRAAVRGALEHFSPQQLTLRFERDSKSLFATSGSRWRAFSRYHQALLQDDDWSERLLTRDFAQAYEEQIRLISILHADYPG
ncbi:MULTISPECIES: type VI secretion system-associated FHA domain protein TagH [unclassified Pseudomonas]|uniref:Type VI secretion system-associated FHA domain protein TagH n=1 Tax=Pseudomonas sp. MYb327 TaxID=2745230 RepID=A0AAU8E050_9PSED